MTAMLKNYRAREYGACPPGIEDVYNTLAEAKELAESALSSLKNGDNSLDDLTRAIRWLSDAADEFRYAAEAAEKAVKVLEGWDTHCEDRLDS